MLDFLKSPDKNTHEDHFGRIIEAIPIGILMVDSRGSIRLCNRELEKLFGYQRAELFGQKMEVLVPQRFRQTHVVSRDAFFAKPETRQMGAGRELFGLRRDGTEIPVEIGLNPHQTAEGDFILASVVDISVRKSLEEIVRRSTEAIQQKNQEMEQFVYTVSHDLKSPLVTISGFLSVLKEDLQTQRYDRVSDSMMRLERASRRMEQLINDLLQLSRVGLVELEFEVLDLRSLLLGICETLAPQISEKNAQVVIAREMPKLIADKKWVYQIFENLIINALKYACEKPGAKIEIGADRSDTEILFYVKDQGPGIAKEYHQKIFGLFQRLEADSRGTGVGLAIVSRAMQLHGGRAWVESQPKQGASFWLAFPILHKPVDRLIGSPR